MSPTPSIFLAYGDTSAWEIVVWLIAGIVGILGQIATNKKRKELQARQAKSAPSTPAPAAQSGGGESPTPNELAEIFKRLGGDIPGTPPPVPRPSPPPVPVPAPQVAQKAAPRPPLRQPAAAVVAPALARRLAQAKREAEAAARQAETERRAEAFAANAIIPGVQSRAGEHRAFDTATRHTGTILPRLYAMSMRLSPWPILPIPGFGPPQQVGVPLRSKLHSRRDVRDALVAQVFLQPAKGLAGR